MIIWNILIKDGDNDNFSISENNSEKILNFSVGGETGLVKSNVRRIFEQNLIVPSSIVSDFLDFGVAIYTIDQIISRKRLDFRDGAAI